MTGKRFLVDKIVHDTYKWTLEKKLHTWAHCISMQPPLTILMLPGNEEP